MKLRIRAAAGASSSSATFKVEVPTPCSLQSLENAIVAALESRGSPIPRPLRVSLNKKEAIQGHPSSLLSQFGICNGDLLFYFGASDSHVNTMGSLSPGEACITDVVLKHSEQIHAPQAHMDHVRGSSTGTSVSMPSTCMVLASKDEASARRELCAAAATRRASIVMNPLNKEKEAENYNSESRVDFRASLSKVSETSTKMQIDGGNTPHDIDMQVDEENIPHDKYSEELLDVGIQRLSHSIPAILQRILNCEHGGVSRPSDFLLLAVHAVMLETGFVVMNLVEEGHTLPGGWLNGGVANICYTLREMSNATNGVGKVALRSLTLGGNVVVYGSIEGSSLPSRKISLLTSKHIIGNVLSHDDPISSFSDLFELWKCAKDELSLPLLTGLCEMAGLPAPSSLLVIPTELKMKILDYLPALDLVKAGCTCSELRHLSANDDFWKKHFCHDFGNPSAVQQLPSFRGWKSAYAVRYFDQKRATERRPPVHRRFYGISSRSRYPRIIGGDYDISPFFRGSFGGARGPLGGLHGRIRDDYLEGSW